MFQQVTQTLPLSWAIVLSPVMTATLTFVTAYLGWRAKKDKDEVKNTLREVTAETTTKLNDIAVVADKTHTLVNSQMGQQLMMYAITARTLADLTHKPEHIQAADEADAKLADHVSKQHLVDSKEDA